MVALAACAGPSDDDLVDAPRWTVSEPSVSIGGYDDRPDYVLDQVRGAVRLTDGRLVIANSGSSELKFFSSEGEHIRTVGGFGEGPGEMRTIMQLVPLPGDTLLVLSFRPGLTWFSPTGDYVRSQTVDLWSVGDVPCRIGEGNWFTLADGSLLTVLEDNFGLGGCPPMPSDVWRQSGLIGRRAAGTDRFDTIAIMPATGRVGGGYRIFGKALALGLGPDRIYAGDTGSDVILSFSLEGDTIGELPVPFTAATIRSKAKSRRDYAYPTEYPRFGRLLVSRPGNLWVMAYPETDEPTVSYVLATIRAPAEGARWRVLSPTGTVLSEVHTPPSLFPYDIGSDYVLGVSQDELGVQTVSLHELTR